MGRLVDLVEAWVGEWVGVWEDMWATTAEAWGDLVVTMAEVDLAASVAKSTMVEVDLADSEATGTMVEVDAVVWAGGRSLNNWNAK
ncbi:hypothetical protein PMIN07_010980 [Paraphaeosphaeria minitans]